MHFSNDKSEVCRLLNYYFTCVDVIATVCFTILNHFKGKTKEFYENEELNCFYKIVVYMGFKSASNNGFHI